jgi:hypothetical protein
MGNMEHYILEELTENIGGGNYQLPLYFDSPIQIGAAMHKKLNTQHQLICDFYDTIVSIARKALANNHDSLIRLLFSEPVGGMTLDYHRNLPDFCWKKPLLFRTDQSISGEIYELQPPGSGWGDIPLIAKALIRNGCSLPNSLLEYGKTYSQGIVKATGKDIPRVFHMLDAASEPSGLRYLFTQTRPMLQYWGIDKDISMHEIDYVTAHSAAALTTCNYFNLYMKMANEGKLVFGISPNLVFDQKAIYILPFYRETKDCFSDEIRAIFPFTSFIENDGFYDENGSFVKLDDFAERKRGQKRYFLKYGGTDLTRNWGSREVYRLDTFSKNQCKSKLAEASQLAKNGEIWLIQKDVSRSSDTVSDDIQGIITDMYVQKKHIKISVFYGINDSIGIKIMARKHYKVHGQTDTFVGIGI